MLQLKMSYHQDVAPKFIPSKKCRENLSSYPVVTEQSMLEIQEWQYSHGVSSACWH
jgi:hypothetical protein